MEIAIRIFVVLHLIGFASLLGGFLTQMKSMKTGGKIVPAILHGAWLLLITGFALVGMVYANGELINNAILGIKAVVITVIFFLAYANSKKETVKTYVLPTIALLAILNVCLAVIGGMTIEA